jgi:hypothetical protein
MSSDTQSISGVDPAGDITEIVIEDRLTSNVGIRWSVSGCHICSDGVELKKSTGW